MSVYKNVGNIFNYNCVDCEYNRHCYGGNLGNQYRFCQKSREKLEDFDKLQQENQKYKEVIDKAIELLGNYKHYSTPDEKQNSDNEDLVNKAFDILKEVE